MPNYIVPTQVIPSLPAARYYDPQLGDYPLDSTGQMLPIHPIDQQVALILCTEYGSIPSVPTMGSKYRKRVERCDPKLIPQIALAEAQAALSALIARGDIKLIGVTVTPPAIANILYANLRDPRTNTRNLSASARSAAMS